MDRASKVRYYTRLVNGLLGAVGMWRERMSEPEKYGTFDNWEAVERHSSSWTEGLDVMISLACEVDPESAPILQNIKANINNLRIRNYQTMRSLEPISPPLPTPEEEAAAEAERLEAYRTGGANLLKENGA